MTSFKKTLVTTALALGALATVTLSMTAPAEAWGRWGGGGWGGCGWGCGGGWGPGVALGVAGLAAGAIIASQAQPAPGCWVRRPVYNAWGHFVGYHNIYVC